MKQAIGLKSEPGVLLMKKLLHRSKEDPLQIGFEGLWMSMTQWSRCLALISLQHDEAGSYDLHPGQRAKNGHRPG